MSGKTPGSCGRRRTRPAWALAAAVISSGLTGSGLAAQEPGPRLELAPVPALAAIVERVSADSILATLRTLEDLGVKSAGSAALEATADWLADRFASFGYTAIVRQEVPFRDYTLENLIVTRRGTVEPDRFLIIDGHYDTIRGPGVNDNGSGVAIMLETARVLADIDAPLSIRYIAFTAEEIGLVGSRAYVREVVVPGAMDIALVLNIDEVGGIAGRANTVVTCERDEGDPPGNNAASAACTDTLAALTRAYSALDTRIAHAYGSDYMPFEEAGYVITGFYETNESDHPHTPGDILANMDPAYVTQIARATVASVLHFARVELVPPG
jgi:hypothetical protein